MDGHISRLGPEGEATGLVSQGQGWLVAPLVVAIIFIRAGVVTLAVSEGLALEIDAHTFELHRLVVAVNPPLDFERSIMHFLHLRALAIVVVVVVVAIAVHFIFVVLVPVVASSAVVVASVMVVVAPATRTTAFDLLHNGQVNLESGAVR